MEPITLHIADRDLPLKLTMHRVELLEELTGVDVLAGGANLGTPKNLALTLYALAGGEPEVGLTLAQFKDELTPASMRAGSALMIAVFKRDSGVGENADAGGKPLASRSRSKT